MQPAVGLPAVAEVGSNMFEQYRERTTTYTDGTHLQVAIPAADLSAAQSVNVTVRNPGSTDSNALSIHVQ